MSNDNTITGVGGRLMVGVSGGSPSLTARIQKWSIDPKAGEHAWGDSDSGGYTNRLAGRKDLTGSVSGIYDSVDRIWSQIREGAEVVLVLWMSGAANHYWYVNAVILAGPKIEIDVDTEEPVGWSFDFGADGKYYAPGEGAPAVSLS